MVLEATIAIKTIKKGTSKKKKETMKEKTKDQEKDQEKKPEVGVFRHRRFVCFIIILWEYCRMWGTCFCFFFVLILHLFPNSFVTFLRTASGSSQPTPSPVSPTQANPLNSQSAPADELSLEGDGYFFVLFLLPYFFTLFNIILSSLSFFGGRRSASQRS